MHQQTERERFEWRESLLRNGIIKLVTSSILSNEEKLSVLEELTTSMKNAIKEES